MPGVGSALQPKRHRPIVDQRNLHIGAELAAGDLRVLRARCLQQHVEQAPTVFRRRRGGKARPQPVTSIGRQRKLRHQKQATAEQEEQKAEVIETFGNYRTNFQLNTQPPMFPTDSQ